jgi:hypothetical protein
MKKALMCMVPTESQAETIVTQLTDAGISGDDVSVVFPDKRGRRTITFEKESKAPEYGLMGVIVGAVIGAIVGAALVYMDRIDVAIIYAALSGATVGGALGGVIGAIAGSAVPEIEAKLHAGHVKEGDLLIVAHVDTPKQAKMTRAIFMASRGERIGRIREVFPRRTATRQRVEARQRQPATIGRA